MAAVTLQGKALKCQVIKRVEGPGLGDLIGLFCHFYGSSDFPRFTVFDAEAVAREFKHRLLHLVITDFIDKGGYRVTRSEWLMRGFVLARQFAKRVGREVQYAAIELDYNTHHRRGVLKIFAHDQPPPVIEVLEWHQMAMRVRGMKGRVIEVKYEHRGVLERAIIDTLDFRNTCFEIRCQAFYALIAVSGETPEWVRNDKQWIRCDIPHQDPAAPKPLLFNDGRIIFEIPLKEDRAVCTVYPDRATVTW